MKTPEQRFGQTRSGKAICTYITEDSTMMTEAFKDFSTKDDFDAYALFQHLLIRELRRAGESDEYQRYLRWSAFHEQRLGDQEKAAQMAALSLVISIDVAQHGKGRADHFFRV